MVMWVLGCGCCGRSGCCWGDVGGCGCCCCLCVLVLSTQAQLSLLCLHSLPFAAPPAVPAAAYIRTCRLAVGAVESSEEEEEVEGDAAAAGADAQGRSKGKAAAVEEEEEEYEEGDSSSEGSSSDSEDDGSVELVSEDDFSVGQLESVLAGRGTLGGGAAGRPKRQRS